MRQTPASWPERTLRLEAGSSLIQKSSGGMLVSRLMRGVTTT